MNLFTYDFMLRALAGALVVGLATPALGIYLVQRRLSLIGDGIGHVALTGVGLGLLLQTSPVLTAVAVAGAAAVAMELVRERGRTSGDVALAILFYGGIAGGVALVQVSTQHSNANLLSYLFGSLLTTTRTDLIAIAVLSAAVFAVCLFGRPWLFAVCQDEEYAKVSGLPVRTLNLTLAVTTAVTVTVAMRAVGLLLVSALMVVPVATAQQFTRGFNTTMYVSMVLGLFAAGTGVVISASSDTSPGATIVLVAIGMFITVTLAMAAARAARRHLPSSTAPQPEPPEVVLEL